MKAKWLTIVSIVVFLLITGCSIGSEKDAANEGAKSGSPKIESVELKKVDNSTLEATVTAEGQELEYAYYIYKDNKLLEKIFYKPNTSLSYKVKEPGEYKVKIFVKNKQEKTNSKYTSAVKIEK